MLFLSKPFHKTLRLYFVSPDVGIWENITYHEPLYNDICNIREAKQNIIGSLYVYLFTVLFIYQINLKVNWHKHEKCQISHGNWQKKIIFSGISHSKNPYVWGHTEQINFSYFRVVFHNSDWLGSYMYFSEVVYIYFLFHRLRSLFFLF